MAKHVLRCCTGGGSRLGGGPGASARSSRPTPRPAPAACSALVVRCLAGAFCMEQARLLLGELSRSTAQIPLIASSWQCLLSNHLPAACPMHSTLSSGIAATHLSYTPCSCASSWARTTAASRSTSQAASAAVSAPALAPRSRTPHRSWCISRYLSTPAFPAGGGQWGGSEECCVLMGMHSQGCRRARIRCVRSGSNQPSPAPRAPGPAAHKRSTRCRQRC